MPNENEKTKFLETISEIKNTKQISYLDAVVYYCEENAVEISVAADLTNSTLKGYLETDARELKMLKKKR